MDLSPSADDVMVAQTARQIIGRNKQGDQQRLMADLESAGLLQLDLLNPSELSAAASVAREVGAACAPLLYTDSLVQAMFAAMGDGIPVEPSMLGTGRMTGRRSAIVRSCSDFVSWALI